MRLAAVLSLALLSSAFTPAPPPEPPRVNASLPPGKWRVQYANGVTEVCEFRNDGTGAVVEPVRIARSKATVSGGSVTMVFENGRVQRWRPVGKRFAVEHWFPGSQLAASPGTLGSAERTR